MTSFERTLSSILYMVFYRPSEPLDMRLRYLTSYIKRWIIFWWLVGKLDIYYTYVYKSFCFLHGAIHSSANCKSRNNKWRNPTKNVLGVDVARIHLLLVNPTNKLSKITKFFCFHCIFHDIENFFNRLTMFWIWLSVIWIAFELFIY